MGTVRKKNERREDMDREDEGGSGEPPKQKETVTRPTCVTRKTRWRLSDTEDENISLCGEAAGISREYVERTV